LGSSWGSGIITDYGFFLNNGLNLFLYGPNKLGFGNTIDKSKQPRALMTPILTYNSKSPCISRFIISCSHHNMMENMDYGLTELANVILKLFTDPQLYESVISDKRVQFSPSDDGVCFEGIINFYLKS
jgi:gamma-glutamyltranspeptidase